MDVSKAKLLSVLTIKMKSVMLQRAQHLYAIKIKQRYTSDSHYNGQQEKPNQQTNKKIKLSKTNIQPTSVCIFDIKALSLSYYKISNS